MNRCVGCQKTEGEFVNPNFCKECREKLDDANNKRKKERTKTKKVGLLDWFINQEFPGLLRIEPKEGNYARGAVKDDGLYFEDELDAIQQLYRLIWLLQDRIRIARYCWNCKTELDGVHSGYQKICHQCGADNEDK